MTVFGSNTSTRNISKIKSSVRTVPSHQKKRARTISQAKQATRRTALASGRVHEILLRTQNQTPRFSRLARAVVHEIPGSSRTSVALLRLKAIQNLRPIILSGVRIWRGMAPSYLAVLDFRMNADSGLLLLFNSISYYLALNVDLVASLIQAGFGLCLRPIAVSHVGKHLAVTLESDLSIQPHSRAPNPRAVRSHSTSSLLTISMKDTKPRHLS